MLKYTTGEVARLCGVTVRTVQYYDSRGILVPTELSEGGRRLYSDDDLKRMRIICFLRGLGLPIDAISQLLSEKDPGSVISLLLEQQEKTLQQEIEERHEKLEKLLLLKQELKAVKHFSVESIGIIAYSIANKEKLKKVRKTMLISGLPISIAQWVSIILWITRGFWWLFVLWIVIAACYAIWISRYYFHHVAYICPQCHTVFKPALRDAFWAKHTPSARKLTCTACGHQGFCVETYGKEESSIG